MFVADAVDVDLYNAYTIVSVLFVACLLHVCLVCCMFVASCVED